METDNLSQCPDCEGEGEVDFECQECSGKGEIVGECPTCHGIGEIDYQAPNEDIDPFPELRVVEGGKEHGN